MRPGDIGGPVADPASAGVHPGRLADLVSFARDHAADPARGADLPARKSALLRRVLGPDADCGIVGPLPQPGEPNGLVIRRGRVVAEFGDTTFVTEIASATKSFLSLVAGLAVDDGTISDVHGSVWVDTGLPILADPHNRTITWHHLLQQTSEWDGSLFGKVPTGHRGQRIGEPLREPGAFWEYNDVRVNLLARALLEMWRRPLADVLRERVMEPLGASDTWSWHGYTTSWVEVAGRRVQSVSGGSHWGGGIWMSARDLARIGCLYLDGGRHGPRQVLSADWIRRTRTSCELNYMYGYMWWLQHAVDGRQVCFAAQGGGSHQCIVVPDHELVVVVRWIQDAAWPALIDRALTVVDDRPPLGPVDYDFARVNARPERPIRGSAPRPHSRGQGPLA
jgi:CubicO group peptidase (beta-lactamase class C family)